MMMETGKPFRSSLFSHPNAPHSKTTTAGMAAVTVGLTLRSANTASQTARKQCKAATLAGPVADLSSAACCSRAVPAMAGPYRSHHTFAGVCRNMTIITIKTSRDREESDTMHRTGTTAASVIVTVKNPTTVQ